MLTIHLRRVSRLACLLLACLLLSSTLVTGQLFAFEGSEPASDSSETSGRSLTLPPLGNTREQDRYLLKEISDQHIFTDGSSGVSEADHNDNSSTAKKLAQETSNWDTTLWNFVAQSRRMVVSQHQLIDYYEDQYRREAPWISRILHRASPFVGHIVELLNERYLPLELALLPVIESGYQPDVISPRQAAGLWQIVPATAAESGVQTTIWFDGRADIIVSSQAAIDYLSYLNSEFHGDWLITLAAYNAGPGRVRNAIKRNRQRNQPIDFWSLPLPEETRHYVPKFLALVSMLRQKHIQGFDIPALPRGRDFELLDIGQRISIGHLASLSGASLAKLRVLNAALTHQITPPNGPHKVYVPQGYAKTLINKLAQLDLDKTPLLYEPNDTHTVIAGDNLSALAIRYQHTVQQLMEMNETSDTLIKVGQKLIVGTSYSSTAKAGFEYVVTIGDTLSEIAERFSVNMADITDAAGNSLRTDVIHPGERLTLRQVSLD